MLCGCDIAGYIYSSAVLKRPVQKRGKEMSTRCCGELLQGGEAVSGGTATYIESWYGGTDTALII